MRTQSGEVPRLGACRAAIVLAGLALVLTCAWQPASFAAERDPRANLPVVFDAGWKAMEGAKITPEMAEYAFARLVRWGWSQEDMRQVLGLCQLDRGLFETYVRLYQKGVPHPAIQACFAACKRDPATIAEYWGYVEKHAMSVPEVQEVFSRFPPNPVQRWQYFYYRTGGFLQAEQAAAARNGERWSGPHTYIQAECMSIFVNTRFNVEYVKKYFALREKGMPPAEAVQPIKKLVMADIQKEREEKERAAAEEKVKKEDEQKALRELQEEEKRRKAAGKGKGKDTELLKGSEVDSVLDAIEKEQQKQKKLDAGTGKAGEDAKKAEEHDGEKKDEPGRAAPEQAPAPQEKPQS